MFLISSSKWTSEANLTFSNESSTALVSIISSSLGVGLVNLGTSSSFTSPPTVSIISSLWDKFNLDSPIIAVAIGPWSLGSNLSLSKKILLIELFFESSLSIS